MMQSEATPAQLSEALRFDPDSGKLFWRQRGGASKKWNTRWAGREAFTSIDRHGYKRGTFAGKNYRAHRVAWAVTHGSWPPADIDHINGDRADNRIVNLRPATRAQNIRNSAGRGGTSRFVGVCWYRNYKKWRAEISADGRRCHIGYFDDEESAARAYDRAAVAYHGEFARVNFKETENAAV